MKSRFRNLIFGLIVCMPIGAIADGASSGYSSAGNAHLAGGEIQVRQSVSGDLYAAGGTITVGEAVANDAALLGGRIDVAAPIGQDLRVTGGKIGIDARIGGELVAAGGEISVSSASSVGGDVMLAGGDVRFAGRAMKDIKLVGGTVVLAGEVRGNARLHGKNIRLEPGTRVLGDLVYVSKHRLSDQEMALVAGKVTREEEPAEAEFAFHTVGLHGAFFVSMLICGSLFLLGFPNAVDGAGRTMRDAPLRSLGMGLAILFVAPPLIILLMVTVIAIPVGLGLMALYPVLLLLGYLCAALFLADAMARVLKLPGKGGVWKIGFLALALALLTMAIDLSVLGRVLVFLAALTGMGSLILWLYKRCRHGRSGADVSPEVWKSGA